MTTPEPATGTPPTPEAKRAQALRESRRRDGNTKRDQVASALTAMLAAGDHISFSAVVRRAGVSTWLTYAPGVREQIHTAIARQADDGRPRRRSVAVSPRCRTS